MAAPDLTFARAQVESLMTDTCRITRNTGGAQDDILDPATLTLDAGPAATVYTGKCKVAPRTVAGTAATASTRDEGDRPQERTGYSLSVPLSVTTIQPGDRAVITASRDPWLVGQRFVVVVPTGGTYRLSRKMDIEWRSDADQS